MAVTIHVSQRCTLGDLIIQSHSPWNLSPCKAALSSAPHCNASLRTVLINVRAFPSETMLFISLVPTRVLNTNKVLKCLLIKRVSTEGRAQPGDASLESNPRIQEAEARRMWLEANTDYIARCYLSQRTESIPKNNHNSWWAITDKAYRALL